MGRRFVPTERRMQRIRAQQFQTNAEGAVRDYEQSIVWLFTVPPIILGLIFIFPFAGEENWRQLWSSSCQTTLCCFPIVYTLVLVNFLKNRMRLKKMGLHIEQDILGVAKKNILNSERDSLQPPRWKE